MWCLSAAPSLLNESNRLIWFCLQLICAMSGAFPVNGNIISTGAGGTTGNSWQQISSASLASRFVSYPGRITNVNPSPPSPNSIYNSWGGFYTPTNPIASQAQSTGQNPSYNNWGQASSNSPISPIRWHRFRVYIELYRHFSFFNC